MSALREVLRSIRRGGKSPLGCPKCGAAVKRSMAPLEGWILPARYICPNCGYAGFLAVEAEQQTALSED